MSVVQAALLGLTAILFAAQLKPLKPEYAVVCGKAGTRAAGDRKRDPDPACVFDNTSPDGGDRLHRGVHVWDL